MINEILQWIVLIWCVWAINNLGSAIQSHTNALKELAKWELNVLDELTSRKPRKSFKERMKEETNKNGRDSRSNS